MATQTINADLDVLGEVQGTSLDINGNADISGSLTMSGGELTVGVNDTGHDVKFFGATSGSSFLYDESEDGVVITHPTDETGLGIYTNSGGVPTVPQLQIGRSTSQYWGVFTGDRDANVIHRQDETSGQIKTNFQQWDSNTSDTTGEWNWQHGNGSGGSLQNVMTLTQAGVLTATTFVGALTGNASGSSGSCTGNAATATTLATARNIGGVSFNGSAAINLPGVNTGGNQNTSGSSASCTGNSATATALTSGNKSITGTFTVSGNINANGNIVGDDGTAITNISSIGADSYTADADSTTTINMGATSMDFLVADNDIFGLGEDTMSVFATLDITGTTDATNATGDTGILRCEGGASIAKKLYVGSTITGSADVIAFSDRKLKENIETLDGKKVLDMRGVSFTRKDTGSESSGVIAQEIQKVAPELVHDTEGTLGVAYGNLVGYLIEAIKDQQKQIDELKERCSGCSK